MIIGDATAGQLEEDLLLRYLDTVTVKGRTQPERIFELLGISGEVPAEKIKAAEAYSHGMTLYQQRKWADAADRFNEGLKADPADGPCAVLKTRCDAYRIDEPAPDWDGVFDIGR